MDTLTAEIEIPDWVRWIAVDKDGTTYAYENKPTKRLGDCYWGHKWPKFGNMKFLYTEKPPKNWKEELYTWS